MKCLGAVTPRTQGGTKNQSTPPLTKQNNGYLLMYQMIQKNVRNYTTPSFKVFGILLTVMLLGSPNGYTAEIDAEKTVQAIWLAEGGLKAKKPFGILSIPCAGYTDCRSIALNTVRNNYQRWQKSDKSMTYLEFLAKRYAPVNAENDPRGYNVNWKNNVAYFMERL